MTSDKKVIEIHGVLQKPLEIGTAAFILEDNGIRRTSAVLEYKQVSENEIHFETLNTIYHLRLKQNKSLCGVILKHMMAELPFMATENIMMDAVKAGGDRQELHERIRELSMIAGKHVKEEGRDNDLLDLIAADEMFHLTKEELEKTMDPSKYTGRASVQVDAFLKNVVNPVLEANKEALGMTAEINV